MVRSAIEVEGEREVRAALRRIEQGAADLKAAHKEAAEVVAVEARNLVPVLSGRLQGTIRAAGVARGGVIRAGFASTPYAGPIHFGWAKHNITPSPFLYDAADSRTDQVLAIYEAQVDALIEKNGLDE